MNTTRRSLAIGATAAALVGLGACAHSRSQATSSVTTAAGRVRGRRTNGVSAFWGIPFGADTAPRRFQPAAPAPGWTGIRDCYEGGPQAPQGSVGGNRTMPADVDPELLRLMQMFRAGTADPLPESEDCLFLNVFTPDPSRAHKRPVLFWLHGGGFALGAGSNYVYDGSALCRRGDVVVVTINHRLNALGYLYLGALHNDFAASGNTGQLDQILALQWVRDNIEAFGGDPQNITIFGESGGGAKVSTLLAMPAARGLFHKAIIQSGPGLRMVERDAAAALAERTLHALGVAPADVHRLQTMDARTIINAATASVSPADGMRSLAPVVDGAALPRHPFHPDAPDTARDIPVIVGTCKDEATLFNALAPNFGQWSEEESLRRFESTLGERGRIAFDLYRAQHPNDRPTHWFTSMMTDRGTWIDSIRLAERKAAQGGALVYMYRLDWETPLMGGVFKTPHGLDTALVFDNEELTPPEYFGPGPEPGLLAAAMSQAWINFARSGNPSLPDAAWAPYESGARQTMLFNVQSQMVADPDRPQREFWSA